MQTSQPRSVKNEKKSTGRHGWKVFGVILGSLVGLVLIGWGSLEYSYQQRVNALKNEAESAWQDVIKPAGGVNENVRVQCPHWLDTTGLVDVTCPGVVRGWYVSIKAGSEFDLMNSILQKEGYTGGRDIQYSSTEWRAGGTKGKFSMEITTSVSSEFKPPYAAPAEKEWRLIGISVSESH